MTLLRMKGPRMTGHLMGPPTAMAGPAPAGGGSLLLVNSGIDPRRPLTGQGDAFWWGSAGFARLEQPYGGFNRLVRGYDPGWTPESPGVDVGPVTVTLDGGCGRGGHLVCACFDSFGEMLDLFQA